MLNPISPNQPQTACNRCGSCCREGGPALHSQDLPLVQSGELPLEHLVTIRRGEPVNKPGGVEPARVELVKLAGKGAEWGCLYFQERTGCSIYDHRPHACRVLECWQPQASLELMERNTLDRAALLGEEHRWLPWLQEHEAACSCDFFSRLTGLTASGRSEVEARVALDLRYRAAFLRKEEGLNLAMELFLFGRPLFQLLRSCGVAVNEGPEGIKVRW